MVTLRGRFESGQMIIGLNNAFEPVINSIIIGAQGNNTIRGNGTDFIEFSNNQSIVPIFGEVTNPNGGGNLPITITEITKDGGQFHWEINGLPAGFNFSSLLGQELRAGGGGAKTIVAANAVNSTITTNDMQIPFLIRDDDNLPNSGVLPNQPDLSGLNIAFQDAYIICENDSGGDPNNNSNNTPFIENASTAAEMAIINAERQSSINESTLFWIVYITSAWQFSPLSDADANGENIHWGGSYPSTNTTHDENLTTGGDYSFAYRETILDVPPPLAESFIIAHEVGHQFGLGHCNGDYITPNALPTNEYPNIGLMSAGGNNAGVAPTNRFIARHLNLIRSRVSSPGE